MDSNIKHIAYVIGKTLGVLGLIFVLYTLYSEYTLDGFLETLITLLPIVPLLIFLNLLSTLFGIKAWHLLLVAYAQKPLKFWVAFYYFAKTEIAKYVPGNIFHMVSRQMIASQLRLTQKEMGHLQFLFFLLLMVSTLVASSLVILFSYPIDWLVLLLFVGTSIGVVTLFVIYPMVSSREKVETLFLLTLSIGLQGVMMALIVYAHIEIPLTLFFQIMAIYILSWIIGFVTPGASGGLGVREAAFISITHLLAIDIAASAVIFAVFLLRLINILVDILYYSSSFFISNPTKESA
jgi:hypothetical protein